MTMQMMVTDSLKQKEALFNNGPKLEEYEAIWPPFCLKYMPIISFSLFFYSFIVWYDQETTEWIRFFFTLTLYGLVITLIYQDAKSW